MRLKSATQNFDFELFISVGTTRGQLIIRVVVVVVLVCLKIATFFD